jgi:hypothetical protein
MTTMPRRQGLTLLLNAIVFIHSGSPIMLGANHIPDQDNTTMSAANWTAYDPATNASDGVPENRPQQVSVLSIFVGFMSRRRTTTCFFKY